MKQILAAAIASIAALAAQASTSTTDLKTLAETVTVEGDSAGTYVNVLGTGDAKPGNQWAWSKDVVFDGYVHLTYKAWFEPTYNGAASGENAWAGIHLTTPAIVHTIRYYARNDGSEYAARAIGCQFQGANALDSNGEFQDPVTLYTIPDTDLDTLTNGWQEVTISDPALLAQAFTYLRVIGSYGGNFAEVEFYGKTWADATSEAPASAPQNLTAVGGADHVTLSWDLPSFPCQSVRVVRGTAPGGPFSTVATLSATTASYEDALSGLVTGVKYYYSACFLNTVESTELPGPFADTAAFRPVAEITFDAQTMTAVEYDHDYQASTATSAAYLFDGDTATKPNVVNASAGNDGVKVGVDFGEGKEYVITGFEVFPSREWSDTLQQWVVGRSDGIQLVGSNDASDWKNGTAISGICDLYKENAWDDTQLSWSSFDTTLTNAYRYVYLKKDARAGLEGQKTAYELFGNVRELKLYGYLASNATSVLLAPEDAAAEWKGSKAVITWTASPNAKSYRVERSADGGDWMVVEQELTEQQYVDRPERPTKVGYIYRVASVDGNGGLAYTVSVTPTGTPSPSGMAIILR